MHTNSFSNIERFDKVIAKIKCCSFFVSQCIFVHIKCCDVVVLYEAVIMSVQALVSCCIPVHMCICQCGTCTLREATIVASVLAKNSVPLLHSAAAIIKIAEMDYNGANSIFLRTLLDKKYALPYQAVDAVVYHFLRYALHPVFSVTTTCTTLSLEILSTYEFFRLEKLWLCLNNSIKVLKAKPATDFQK